MIAWMLYSLLVSLLLGLCAHAADRVLRLRSLATRWVWAAFLSATLLVPTLWPLVPRAAQEESATLVPATFVVPLDAVVADVTAAPAWPLPRVLLTAWLMLSALLVAYGVFAALRLRVARRRWRSGELAGQPVLVSPHVGPAVVGLIDPAIVVPSWVNTLSHAEQALIMAHERAHIAAHDHWLVTYAFLLPAVFPWNPLVWWQSRRLREAVELDCDARLLAGTAAPRPYAELLLNVGSRTAVAPLAVAALTEPRSLLEKRIRRMFEERPSRHVLRASGWVTVAVLAGFAALRAPLPGEPMPRALASAEQAVSALAAGLTVDTVKPRLLNRAEVDESSQSYYPPLLRDAGIEGVTRVQVYVNERGEVAVARVLRSSGHAPLDEAALRVAGVMKFSPALVAGRATALWFEVPVTFVAKRGASAREIEASRQERERQIIGVVEKRDARVESAFTETPSLNNRAEVAGAINRLYPPTLRRASIGGRVVLSFLVNERGEVEKAELKSSSGLQELDDAALQLAAVARFVPGRNASGVAKGWVDLPVDFNAASDEAPARVLPRSQNPSPESAPTFTPYTVKPSLRNVAEISEALQRYYPAELRDAGIGGTANMWFFIDEQGRVTKTQLKRSTGNRVLDEAAERVAELMQFSPALNRDQPVKVWIDMPIVFKGKQPEAAARAPLNETIAALVPGPAPARRRDYPMVSNTEEVSRALQRYYPPLLRDAGIGGTVTLDVVTDGSGKVVRSSVRQTSGHSALDMAALKVIELARFEAIPAGESFQIPFTFRTQ